MTEPERKPCLECGKEVTWTQAGKPRQHKCELKETPAQPQAHHGNGVTADRVIEAFIQTRDEMDMMKKELEVKLASMKEIQEKRAAWLKAQMKRLGVTSLKGEHGTCFTDVKDSATVADRGVFFEWVKTHDRYEFLESRVSKTAVKQLLEEGETLPPGVNYTKVEDVKIRRK